MVGYSRTHSPAFSSTEDTRASLLSALLSDYATLVTNNISYNLVIGKWMHVDLWIGCTWLGGVMTD
jgi:hypothetical protein